MFILTKEPIYSFLKKFVNKQKIIKKITISRLRIGCWHPRRKIKICYSVLTFAGSMCCIPLLLRGHGHQMIVRPHPFFLQKFSFYSWDKLASGPTRTQFVYIAIFVSLCWCGLKFEKKGKFVRFFKNQRIVLFINQYIWNLSTNGSWDEKIFLNQKLDFENQITMIFGPVTYIF